MLGLAFSCEGGWMDGWLMMDGWYNKFLNKPSE